MRDGLKKTNFLDYSILIPYVLLAIIGVVMVFSTTVPDQLMHGASPYKPTISQSAFIILSWIMISIVYRMKLKALKSQRLMGFILVIIILALLACRFAPASVSLFRPVNGARGWIQLPGIGTIQPAEIAKFFVVWYLASIFSEKQEAIQQNGAAELFKGKNFLQKYFISGWRLPFWIITGLIFIMPDLGNAVIITLLAFVMVGASGISWRWFSGIGKLITGISVILLGAMFATQGALANIIPLAHVRSRFIAFVNPFKDSSILANQGHQMANSYYAIVNGGWFGRGLGNSIEKNGFLPEATTDFIFPVVVEELGIIGAILILGILFFLITRILLVGIRARNPFNSLMALGIGSLLLLQVFINLGGAIGIIPETGVTFPFISQGGSSFLVLSLGIAFVLNISADEKRREIKELSAQYISINYEEN